MSGKTKHRLFPSYNAQRCQVELLPSTHTQQVLVGGGPGLPPAPPARPPRWCLSSAGFFKTTTAEVNGRGAHQWTPNVTATVAKRRKKEKG